MALVVTLGAWGAVSAFPLHAGGAQASQLATGPGPLERRARSVTPENPVPRRIHYEEPLLPDIAKDASAKVLVKVTLDSAGTVAEARPAAIAVKGAAFSVDLAGDDFARRVSGIAKIWSSDPALAGTVRETVLALVDSAVTSVKAWRYDPPAEAPLTFSVSIRYGDEPETMRFVPNEEKALRVGGEIKPPEKIRDVRPVYPPVAQAAGVKGVVIIEIKIGTDGGVEEARVLKSIPLLDEAALDAVKQWRFTPTLLNGQPTALMMAVTIKFDID
jgi:protein TonB